MTILIMSLLASASLAGGEPLFHDVVVPGSELTSGSPNKDWILEVNGGGLILADFDGSGSLDLVVVDGSTPKRAQAGEPGFAPRLLWNDGKAGFSAADAAWSLAPGRWGSGGAAGDLNGDGRADLVVLNWGADQAFLNSGSGFKALEKSGLVGQAWGTSAALLDYDMDGVLDMYVVNYLDFDFERIASRESGECVWKGEPVNCGPEGLVPQADQLYRGLGDGRFELGVLDGEVEAAFGLGVVAGDYDDDGDQDLYVTNDSMANHLWRNDRAEGFVEVGMRMGVGVNGNGREEAGMGVAQGDLDGDGRLDYLVTNFSGESHSLYMSGGRRSYRERSGPRGVGGSSVALLGWGTGLGDLDLDGDLDLFGCHGHVYPGADRPGSDTSYAQGDVLWRNEGDGSRPAFRAEALDDGGARVSRAAVMADLDRDGDLDLLAAALDGPVHLLVNRAADDGALSWLGVRLKNGQRTTLGARVEVELEDGQRLVREMTSSAGFQACGPEEVHFGLGAAKAIAGLQVRWPDGELESFEVAETSKWVTLERSE